MIASSHKSESVTYTYRVHGWRFRGAQTQLLTFILFDLRYLCGRHKHPSFHFMGWATENHDKRQLRGSCGVM
jgi:hypothetical protein